MLASQAAEILRVAEEVKALHAEIGTLKQRIGCLSDYLGSSKVSWRLQGPGVVPGAAVVTIGGAAAQLMLEQALASLRGELERATGALARLPMPWGAEPAVEGPPEEIGTGLYRMADGEVVGGEPDQPPL